MKKLLFIAILIVMSIDAKSQTAYIPVYDHSIYVIDVSNDIVTDTINVGWAPNPVTVSLDGNRAYFAYHWGVGIISTATNTLLDTIQLAGASTAHYGIVVTPDGSKIYVTNNWASTVSAIFTSSNVVFATIPVLSPWGITVSPDGSKVYVSSYSISGGISVISTTTNMVIDTISLPSSTYFLCVNPDGSKVYAAGDGGVFVINTLTDSVHIITSMSAYGICISPDGNKVYFTRCAISNTVGIINTQTDSLISTIAVGDQPGPISISPDGSKVYVVNQDSYSVSVISTEQIL